MKRVEKFRTGEAVPDNGKYLFSVLGKTRVDIDGNELPVNLDSAGTNDCPDLDEPSWVHWHFYEI